MTTNPSTLAGLVRCKARDNIESAGEERLRGFVGTKAGMSAQCYGGMFGERMLRLQRFKREDIKPSSPQLAGGPVWQVF